MSGGCRGRTWIIKTGGRAVPEDVLSRAAALAAYYSGGARRGPRRGRLYTLRKYVRKIKGR
jgi:predicted ribosome quality control (RQC) complex YloA/Tae2 family protein